MSPTPSSIRLKRMGMMTGSYLTNVLNGEGVKQAFKGFGFMRLSCARQNLKTHQCHR